MEIQKVRLIYFSPMGKTKKIIEGIYRGLQVDNVEYVDLTTQYSDTDIAEISGNELVIVGVPVYGGRIPEKAVNRLKKYKSDKTLAVAVVVYGNREYQGALRDLRDIISDNGFLPLAGGAFIGSLSCSDEGVPLAAGRPDSHDIDKSREFGAIIKMKLEEYGDSGRITPIRVPGNDPYKEVVNPSDLCPVTFQSSCARCEACVSACPTEAISLTDGVKTDRTNCVLCCACIRKCPNEARVMEEPEMKDKVVQNEDQQDNRKEPEMYL